MPQILLAIGLAVAGGLLLELTSKLILESVRPMQFSATGGFLLMNAVLFVYLRPRIGPWGP